MTDLRTAAKLALEALDAYSWEQVDAARTALRAALAEPENWELRRLREELERCKQTCAATSEAWREEAALAEPVPGQGCGHCNQPLYAAIKCRVCGRETPIIEPKIKRDNKPVAWIHTDPDKPRVRFLEWRENEPGYRGDWIKTPLYAAPPQRKPLTEEEIDSIWDSEKAFADIYAIVRAIERAHGIGEQQ